MSIGDEINAFTAAWSFLPYYAGGNDADRDGIPDRADLDDRNGVDCSGWTWALWRHLKGKGYYAFTPVPPLGTTSTYANAAQANGWWLPRTASLQPGDTLLWAQNGDVFHSDGAGGHVGTVVYVSGTKVTTSESAGSSGVGLYTRNRSWWTRAFRMPGWTTPTPTPGPAPPTPTHRKDDDMRNATYNGQTHTVWLEPNPQRPDLARIHHTWHDKSGGNGHEIMSQARSTEGEWPVSTAGDVWIYVDEVTLALVIEAVNSNPARLFRLTWAPNATAWFPTVIA